MCNDNIWVLLSRYDRRAGGIKYEYFLLPRRILHHTVDIAISLFLYISETGAPYFFLCWHQQTSIFGFLLFDGVLKVSRPKYEKKEEPETGGEAVSAAVWLFLDSEFLFFFFSTLFSLARSLATSNSSARWGFYNTTTTFDFVCFHLLLSIEQSTAAAVVAETLEAL